MSETPVKPYTVEVAKKSSPSNISVIYAAAAIILPFVIWILLSLVRDSAIMDVARLATSIIAGVALVIIGINLIRISKRENSNPVFAIVGLVVSSVFAVASIFLTLVVAFALFFTSIQ